MTFTADSSTGQSNRVLVGGLGVRLPLGGPINERCVLHAAERGSQGFTSFYLGNLVPTAGRPGQCSPSLPTSTARVAPEKSVYPDPACRGFLRRVDGVNPMTLVVKAKNGIEVFQNENGDIVIREVGSGEAFQRNEDSFVVIHVVDLDAVTNAMYAAAKE